MDYHTVDSVGDFAGGVWEDGLTGNNGLHLRGGVHLPGGQRSQILEWIIILLILLEILLVVFGKM